MGSVFVHLSLCFDLFLSSQGGKLLQFLGSQSHEALAGGRVWWSLGGSNAANLGRSQEHHPLARKGSPFPVSVRGQGVEGAARTAEDQVI